MENRIDFREIKLVPIASVLRHYEIDVRRQGEFIVASCCPLPTHTSQEPDTFKVSVKENWWTCFSQSCRKALGKNGGDVIDFVRLKEGLKPLDAAKKLAELFCVKGPSGGLLKHSEETAIKAIGATPTPNRPLAFELQGIEPENPMIRLRGISVETAKKWGAGLFPGKGSMRDRIVFPLFENGALIGYAGRTVLEAGADNPKWKLGKGLKKTFLYGLERCDPAKPVIIVESPWAVLWFDERGQQAAALLGSEMTEEQERQLEPYPTLIIALDNDEKGREAAVKIINRLKGKHKVIRSFLQE